jgi:predicted transcriptional regulator
MNVLLSIKPEYTEKIFGGEKKYEFRKQIPKLIVESVFVYECRPSTNIVGYFTVKRILSGSPRKIWEKCKKSSGIEKKEFFSYCNGKRFVYAFEIDRTFPFVPPINPFEICPDFKPPQNFSYLGNSTIFKAIKKQENNLTDKAETIPTIKRKSGPALEPTHLQLLGSWHDYGRVMLLARQKFRQFFQRH